jgi:hypothetical protein
MPRTPYHKKSDTVDTLEMDRALIDDPPVIVWRHNGKGIQVAMSVHDPHAEKRWGPRAPECTDESLLNAARTEL